LMRLNNVGFEITENCEKLIDDESLAYSKKLNIAPWLLLAGQHGEFELVLTIPQNLKQKFLEEAEKNGFVPIELGKVILEKEIRINLYNKSIPINSVFIRNLPFETKGDVNHYLKLLLEYDSELKKIPQF
jgi:thiamine-monophosphate kinase